MEVQRCGYQRARDPDHDRTSRSVADVEDQESHRPDEKPLQRGEAPDNCDHDGSSEDPARQRGSVKKKECECQGQGDQVPGHLESPQRVLVLDKREQQQRYRGVVDPRH